MQNIFYTIIAFKGKVIPFNLADLAPGIAEMQIKKW